MWKSKKKYVVIVLAVVLMPVFVLIARSETVLTGGKDHKAVRVCIAGECEALPVYQRGFPIVNRKAIAPKYANNVSVQEFLQENNLGLSKANPYVDYSYGKAVADMLLAIPTAVIIFIVLKSLPKLAKKSIKRRKHKKANKQAKK